jgi:hypothetical protein
MALAAMLGSLAVSWLIVSLAVFTAGKLIAGSRATFSKSLALIFIGVVIVSVTYAVASIGLTPVVGGIIAFIVWLFLIRVFFEVGWLSAFLIAILAVILLSVIIFICLLVLSIIGFAAPPSYPSLPVV